MEARPETHTKGKRHMAEENDEMSHSALLILGWILILGTCFAAPLGVLLLFKQFKCG